MRIKNIIVVLSIFVLTIGLFVMKKNSRVSYFSNVYNIEVKNNDKYLHDENVYSIYKKIISNKLSFNNDYFDEKVVLDNIEFDEYTLSVDNFGLVDMNDDNIPELIIDMSVNKGAGFVLVIHVDEEVYSYFFFDKTNASNQTRWDFSGNKRCCI